MPNSSQKGFTLIELLVVISIISMLSSVAYASYGTVKAKSRDTKRAADTVQLRTALTAYEIDHNGLPAATVAAGCIAASDSNPTPTWVCTTSQSLNATLQPLVSGKYISAIPVDPLNSGGITYYYSTGASTGNDPVTGTALAPSASFNYVSETRTSQTTPAIYGTNVGTPNYTYYASTGYPSSVGAIVTAVQPSLLQASLNNISTGYSNNSYESMAYMLWNIPIDENSSYYTYAITTYPDNIPVTTLHNGIRYATFNIPGAVDGNTYDYNITLTTNTGITTAPVKVSVTVPPFNSNGAPWIGPSETPVIINPGGGGQTPTGGHDYSAP